MCYDCVRVLRIVYEGTEGRKFVLSRMKVYMVCVNAAINLWFVGCTVVKKYVHRMRAQIYVYKPYTWVALQLAWSIYQFPMSYLRFI